ncbi:mechanosensitive ion channel family protein [Sanguibacter suaedae]|uniref:Mechanosensitive ion channel family protein n=1 Tax=Sanguibacter suaedae TaxID=2795737 RepID=A0A934IDJ8_9MICO|nr:mechanosensitive ion channel family protein [Sanguibacter suaedae]MBI9115785.1 mechanosensitive ion channel family protein [Sanguibacter suaedae]
MPPETDLTEATNVAVTAIAVVGAVVAAFLVGAIISGVVRRAGRNNWLLRDLSTRMRRPLRAVLVVVGVWLAVRLATDSAHSWRAGVEHLLLILFIVVGAWFVGSLAFVVEDGILKRYRTDTADNRHARRVRTQIIVVRRLTVAVIVICGFAGILLTFPAARAAGASLLASAGLVSIVAGLAAQTALGNVFAGMQIAFTDAIRVDDVVVLEGEWGRIEEITMTYVVVHIWDDRRLILPCTYFTTTPFENWTRRAAELLGTVEIDLDWDVPLAEMRAELTRLLDSTPLWDERVGVLQVTEATHGFVRVRAMASAQDAGTLFDLRCYLREGLVEWLQREAPQAKPRTRLLGADGAVEAPLSVTDEDDRPGGARPGKGPAGERKKKATQKAPERIPVRVARPGLRMRLSEPSRGPHPTAEVEETQVMSPAAGLFTGSADAQQRSKAFSGPGQEVIDERERTAQIQRVEDEEGDVRAGEVDGRRAPAEEGGRE